MASSAENCISVDRAWSSYSTVFHNRFMRTKSEKSLTSCKIRGNMTTHRGENALLIAPPPQRRLPPAKLRCSLLSRDPYCCCCWSCCGCGFGCIHLHHTHHPCCCSGASSHARHPGCCCGTALVRPLVRNRIVAGHSRANSHFEALSGQEPLRYCRSPEVGLAARP